MSNCHKCTAPIPANTKYCTECGSRVNVCPDCGLSLPDGAKFCGNCGASFGITSSTLPFSDTAGVVQPVTKGGTASSEKASPLPSDSSSSHKPTHLTDESDRILADMFACSECGRNIDYKICKYCGADTSKPRRSKITTVSIIAVFVLISVAVCLVIYELLPQVIAGKEFRLGVDAFNSKNYPEAVTHFEEAVRLEPTLPNAKRSLATALVQEVAPGLDTPENTKTAYKAINLYTDMLKDNPKDLYAIKAIANLHLALREPDEALKWEKKVLDVDPTDAMAIRAVDALKPCNNIPNITSEMVLAVGDNRTLPTFLFTNQIGNNLNGLLSAVDDEDEKYMNVASNWQEGIKGVLTTDNPYAGAAVAEYASGKGEEAVQSLDELKRRAAYFAREWKGIDSCYRRQFANSDVWPQLPGQKQPFIYAHFEFDGTLASITALGWNTELGNGDPANRIIYKPEDDNTTP